MVSHKNHHYIQQENKIILLFIQEARIHQRDLCQFVCYKIYGIIILHFASLHIAFNYVHCLKYYLFAHINQKNLAQKTHLKNTHVVGKKEMNLPLLADSQLETYSNSFLSKSPKQAPSQFEV